MNRRERSLRLGSSADPFLGLLLLLTVFALGPLMQPGYFWGAHDARHSVYFLFEFDRAVQDGILYPRWAPDFAFGYGYPFFNIYAPLPSYIGEFFHLLGLDFVDSVKMVFGLSIVGSAIGMYIFLRRLMGRPAALIGSLVYVYAPYHLFDLYVRAALAESVALAFLPFVLWGFHESAVRPRAWSIAGAGLAYAGLMFSSNLLTLMFTPLLALYVGGLILVKVHSEQPLSQLSKESLFALVGHLVHRAVPVLASLGIGLGLSAIFWLPALTESGYVRADQWLAGAYDYHDDFVYFHQLFSPFWGFGTSGPGPNDGVGFQLGAVPLTLVILSVGSLRRHSRPEVKYVIIFSQLAFVAVVFMTLQPAVWIWDQIPFARYAQFPWRYFSLALPLMGVLSSSILCAEREPCFEDRAQQWKWWGAILLLSAAVLMSSYPYVRAEIRPPAEGPVSLAGLMRFQHVADEMTGATIWTPEIPTWSPMADIWVAGGEVTTRVDYSIVPQNEVLAVDSRQMDSVHEKVWVWASDDRQVVRFYRFYYPGWKAYILDEETEKVIMEAPILTTGPHGLITVPVPQGRHLLLLRFEDTAPRIVGRAVTILCCTGLLLWGVLRCSWAWRGGRRHV